MIPHTLGSELAEEMARATSEAELRILKRLVDLLGVGLDNPNIDYQREQLGQMQKLNNQLIAELRSLNVEAAARIQASLSEAYGLGSASALRDLSGVVASASAITAPATSRALQAIAEEYLGKVASVSNAVLRTTPDVYRDVIARAVEQSTLGSITRKQAAQQALDQLLGKGILIAPENSLGQRMSLTDYVTMATRTANTNAAFAGHSQALLDYGFDLCMVQPGPRHCERCDFWANKVLSVSGQSRGTITQTDYRTGGVVQITVVASLEEARAGGWGHPNCRCGLKAYVPGVTKTEGRMAWDEVGYEAQQRQREIERQIRAYKTRQTIAVDEKAGAAAGAKVAQWQQAQRDLLKEFPFLKRQYSREQI